LEHSLKKRFSSKLITNLINAGASLIIMSLVPRSLGPVAFGNFSFLTETFNKIVGFLGFGTPIAFYTKLSQRQKEQKIIRFYIYFLLLVLIIGLVFLFISYYSSGNELLFPNQKLKYVFLAYCYAYLLFIVQIVRQVNDAYGFTIQSEKIFVYQKLFSLVLVVILYFTGILNLFYYFFHFIIVFSGLLLFWIFNLYKKRVRPFNRVYGMSTRNIKDYILEFSSYSHPLVLMGIFVLIIGVGERWILQYFGGSEQQGYYSLSYKVTTIIFLFTGAMTPLFTRDFAIAWDKQDFTLMRNLFNRLVPPLVGIAAFFSLFVAANGQNIGVIFGGNAYQSAGISIAVMAIYPIHQTFGQLCGSIFFATGKTKLYRNISIPVGVFGLFLSVFFIAPNTYGGLNLGSLGLVMKMVIGQIIGVNILLFYSLKIISLSYWKTLKFQIIITFVFAIFAFGIKYLILELPIHIILKLIINGIIYTLVSALFIYSFPSLVSSSREEIIENYKKLKIRLTKHISKNNTSDS
jgi:O-antigen/teichoic acid export membrane protein